MGRLVIKSPDQMHSKGFDLRLECLRCRRVAVLRSRQLLHWVRVLKWPKSFDAIAARFPCKCGRASQWSFIGADDDRDVLDLNAVARDRRDHFLSQARFCHELSLGWEPGERLGKRNSARAERERRERNAEYLRRYGGKVSETS